MESREPALNVALIAHAAQEFPGIGTTATDLTGSAEVLLSSEGYHNLSPTISSLVPSLSAFNLRKPACPLPHACAFISAFVF